MKQDSTSPVSAEHDGLVRALLDQSTVGAEEDVVPDPKRHPTVTVPRAGRILKISRSSAYAAAQAGQIPTIKVGRRLLVPTAALLELLGQKAS